MKIFHELGKNFLNNLASTYFTMEMGDSHVAGKKYWIISQVVEVIMSKSNDIYHEWPTLANSRFC